MPNKNSIESEIDKVVGSLSPSICMDTRHDYWDKQAKLATKQLKYLIQREVKKGRVEEHKIIFDEYATNIKKIAKKHGIKPDVPHTAFHQISEDRLEELSVTYPQLNKYIV